MSFLRYPEYCSNSEYHFAGAGKPIAGGKGTAQRTTGKMATMTENIKLPLISADLADAIIHCILETCLV